MGGIDTTTESLQNAPETSGTALILYHQGGIKLVPLEQDIPVIVGRTWPADVVVEDPSLSRKHLRVCYTKKGVEVEDLGSTNGTLVAGERIDKTILAPGDPFFAGGVTLSVNVASAQHRRLGGIDTHEQFLRRVHDDTIRSKTFHRSFSVVMLRSGGIEGHLASWLPRVRRELRQVDRIGPYGPNSALVLLAEADRETAERLASQMVTPRFGEPRLYAGLATFPQASSPDELIEQARTACRRATPEEPLQLAASSEGSPEAPLLVASPSMVNLYAMVDRIAPAQLPVLIHGETGSGKERVAQAIHRSSNRREKELLSINCGAIPATLLESVLFGHEKGAFTGADSQRPGVFEQARGGTVFLDEVGELSAASQTALLRVIETKRLTRVGGVEEVDVDVRVIAATHRNLEAMVEEGTFRQDLFYRLNAIILAVPPLRERVEEIDLLADHFLEEAARENGFSPKALSEDARQMLRDYRWPGNVRELRNVVERAVLIAQNDLIDPEDLPAHVRAEDASDSLSTADALEGARPTDAPPLGQDVDFKERIRQYEVDLILEALRRSDGNQTQAAKLLRMPLRTLVHKIKSYGIKKSYDM